MEETENTPEVISASIPEGKVYRDKVIYQATFFGGPLVAGYMMASNFKVFSETEKAKWTWLFTIIFCVMLFSILIFLPDEIGKSPIFLIPLFYSLIAYYLAKYLQQAKIKAHLNAGGQKYSGWRALLISIIGLLVFVIPFLGISYVQVQSKKANVNRVREEIKNLGYNSDKAYGKNEIFYDTAGITNKMLDTIAGVFYKTGCFIDTKGTSVMIKKQTCIAKSTF